ncbi:hypothetical protein [Emcibacter nanhaiensis]|uniref:Uncharacterized protein n=1 Tax=Emcibacter nanhaiensis TaxID=1505037 RepID=A0A501PRW5_9PROT|nr:hypothetical protein [Emcibacter nanhaiensis]TPD62898.1 hypothetical protein FIV46_02130 [Emcibacter nanhaiensis]
MKCVFSATLLAALFMVNVAYADKQVIVVDHNICRQLVPHVPAPDVEYKPGEDVRGQQVVPADIPGSYPQFATGDASFYLVQDLADLAGSRMKEKYPGLSQDMIVGYVELKNGVAYLNGKPLSAQQNSELVYICRKIKSEKLAPDEKR